MLRRDRKYGDEMRKSAVKFSAEVEKAAIPAPAKAEISRKLADYQRDFGLDGYRLALAGELTATSDAFSAVQPIIEETSKAINDIGAEAERENLRQRDGIQRQIEIAILLIAAVVLGVEFSSADRSRNRCPP